VNRKPLFRVAIATILIWASCADGQQPVASTQLAGQMELARLVDVAAERLNLSIDYDRQKLTGNVTLRLGEGVSDQELWTLVNGILAARGFTTVRGPSATLSVVAVADAAGVAAIDPQAAGPPPGFTTTIVRASHRPAADLIKGIEPLLSRPGGRVVALGDGGLILLSDLTARIEQANRVLEILDSPTAEVRVEEVPALNLSGQTLAMLVAQVVAKREAVGGGKPAGDVLVSASGNSLLVIAPAGQVEGWKTLISQLDQREPVETRTYLPGSFTAEEVGGLIEQSVRGAESSEGADGWRLVTEDLTGTLILTATPDQHGQVEALFQRLAALPPGARRPVRSFVVRNRSVGDILQVLEQLVGAGALEAGEEAPASDVSLASEAADGSSAQSNSGAQRTERRVLPPGTTPTSPPPSRTASWALGTQGSAPPVTQGQNGSLPPLTLTADEGTSTIIAVGEPRLLAQVEKLIQQLDVRQPQVMLEVMLVSLTEGQTFDLGVELEKFEVGTDAMVRLASLFGLSVPTANGGRTTGQARGFSGVVLDPGDFAATGGSTERRVPGSDQPRLCAAAPGPQRRRPRWSRTPAHRRAEQTPGGLQHRRAPGNAGRGRGRT
jgi:type II secretory pathway component GspD/PulD (secretin)